MTISVDNNLEPLGRPIIHPYYAINVEGDESGLQGWDANRKHHAYIALESPTTVHGEHEDNIVASIEGVGQHVEVLGLRRPDALLTNPYELGQQHMLNDSSHIMLSSLHVFNVPAFNHKVPRVY